MRHVAQVFLTQIRWPHGPGALARKLQADEPSSQAWAEAFQEATETVSQYSGARAGDRTMMDALLPAAEAALKGAKSGEEMHTHPLSIQQGKAPFMPGSCVAAERAHAACTEAITTFASAFIRCCSEKSWTNWAHAQTLINAAMKCILHFSCSSCMLPLHSFHRPCFSGRHQIRCACAYTLF